MRKKSQKPSGAGQREVSQVDELDQLEMFRDDNYGDADEQPDDDFEEPIEDQDFASVVEEELAEAEEALEADNYDEQPQAAGHSQRRVSRDRSAPSGGAGALLVLGLVVLTAGLGLLAAAMWSPPTFETMLGGWKPAGLTPTTLTLIGLILTGTAWLRRRQTNIESRVGDVEGALLDNDSGIATSLDFLVEAQEQHLQRTPASGEELERVLIVLQRQDDKINNLTRAIKMYGKPLVEITKQVSELVGKVEAMRSSVGTVAEAAEKSGLEEALGNMSSDLQKKLGVELDKILSEVSSHGDADTRKGLEELKKELSDVATNLARLQSSGAVAARPASQDTANPKAAKAKAATPAKTDAGGDKQEPSGGGALAHSISGTKKASAKGVLGSIAKLKRMRK